MKKTSVRAVLILIIALLLSGCQQNARFSALAKLSVSVDSDQDGLPDAMEQELGTDPSRADTDEDGLSDYLEVCKYRTNPLNADSDQDGVADSNWEERREYTYTLQAVVDLRPPFCIEDMNDFYQDARNWTQVAVKDEYNLGYPDLEGRLIADHVYHEVLLGGQWVRVDYDIDTGVRVFGQKPYIKILACHDQVDHGPLREGAK